MNALRYRYSDPTKSQATDIQSTWATAQLTRLDLTKATKETNEYLYRTDGTLYGHKNIKEQVDQAGFGNANLAAAATAKKEVTTKETTPSKTWIWLAAGLVCIIILLAYLKFLR
ncbi:hypothetical protein [Pedobacter sp. UYP24]